MKRIGPTLGALIAAVVISLGAVPARAAGESAEAGWLTDEAQALKVAQAEGKPVLLDFWAKWCVACLDLGHRTFPDPGVKTQLDGFVLAKIDMDAPQNQPLWDKYAMSELPQVWFLRPDGTRLEQLTLREFEGPGMFADRVRKARAALGMPAVGGAATGAALPAPAASAEAPAKLGAPVRRDFGALPETAVAQRPHVTARLVADTSAVQAGRPFRVGVHLSVDDGWHVYWKNSGDSGLPTRVDLKAPEGFSVGELQWPAPLRYAESGGQTAYGYAEEVLLFATVTPPADATGEVALAADADWLVCEKKCIPGAASLSRSLPIGEATPDVAAAFDVMAARVPGPTAQGAEARGVLGVSAVRPGDRFVAVFELRGSAGALAPHADEHVPPFIPEKAQGLELSGVDHRFTEDGALVVRVRGIGGPDTTGEGRVAGLLQAVDASGYLRRVAVELPVPRAAAGAEVERSTDPLLDVLPPLPDDPERPAVSATTGAASSAAEGVALWKMLLFALIGGLLLNVMPCVLPVLSLKALGLVRQSGEDRRTIWHHGLAFGGGVLASFLVLAVAVIVLKASGELVGWGFQFQNPGFVVSLMAVVFAFSLSLFGVFEVNLPGMQAAAGVASRHGLAGSFFNGVFATLLATPCTAPFLGTALGFAFGQPAPIILAVLMTVGSGLALPFVVLARFPAWLRKIPRPGPWMDHFKHAMGFLLVGTVIWLLDVLSYQVTTRALVGAIVFLGIIAVAVWMYGRFGGLTATVGRQVTMATLAAGLIAAGAVGTLNLEPPPAQACEDATDELPPSGEWVAFSDARVQSLSAAGYTVFIDFTAAWCWTCKANESGVIESTAVMDVVRELGVVMVKADWTNKDESISAWLRRFDRVGVPLYVILPGTAPDQPIVLPEIITTDLLIESLRKAGPSRAEQS